ncbi:replication protein, partial [Salmonella enterica]|nr:replication protein [Salmonella enterica]
MKPFSQLLAQYQADIEVENSDKSQGLSRAESELIDASVRIKSDPPSPNDFTFMHSIMCQVGLPRSRVNGSEFERRCGAAGLYIRAGKIWDGKQFLQQPVPYGPMPRLVMAYLNTQALRSKSPEINVGNSASAFLKQLGKESSGG